MYDCPHCHSDRGVELAVKGDWMSSLGTRECKYSIGTIFPCVCLDCGTIYISLQDLEQLNEKYREYNEED